jgi:hypothetical protein
VLTRIGSVEVKKLLVAQRSIRKTLFCPRDWQAHRDPYLGSRDQRRVLICGICSFVIQDLAREERLPASILILESPNRSLILGIASERAANL